MSVPQVVRSSAPAEHTRLYQRINRRISNVVLEPRGRYWQVSSCPSKHELSRLFFAMYCKNRFPNFLDSVMLRVPFRVFGDPSGVPTPFPAWRSNASSTITWTRSSISMEPSGWRTGNCTISWWSGFCAEDSPMRMPVWSMNSTKKRLSGSSIASSTAVSSG